MEKGSSSSSNPDKGKNPMTESSDAPPTAPALMLPLPLPEMPMQPPHPVPGLMQDLNLRPEQNMVLCIVCGRDFRGDKALYGHMRSHRTRGWRGAFPPPTFNRNEFLDVAHLLGDYEENAGGAGGGVAADVAGDVVVHGGVPGAASGAGGDAAGGSQGGASGAGGNNDAYKVPDLNESPPKE